MVLDYKTQEKTCPYCNHKDSLQDFISWEKDGKRGALGKTPEGYIMILCPNCGDHIKFDPLSGNFLRKDEKSRSGIIFNLIFLLVAASIIYGIYRFFT